MDIVELRDAGDSETVGGKAARLGSLLRNGVRVPDGFVVVPKSPVKWVAKSKDTIRQRFDKLGVRHVAVRSSAVAEDSDDASWAGQFDTFLFVNREQLIDKIKRCVASASSLRSAQYGKFAGKTGGHKIAVLVQAMIPSDISGVCFTVHPVTQNSDHIVIEAVNGLGEAIVSGEITPDNYVVSRKLKNILSSSIATQKKALRFSEAENGTTWFDVKEPSSPKLSEGQILELAATAEQLENHFKHPVDIEWAFHSGSLYILQSRPITTLG